VNQRKQNMFNGRMATALKLCIAAGALLFIWHRVLRREGLHDLWVHLDQLRTAGWKRWLLAAAVALMPVNWLAEAAKWRLLVIRLEHVGWVRSATAIVAGLTVSFFTPNRIGEYAGRILFLSPGNRIRGTLLTVIENLAQLTVTLLLGLLALPYFLYRYAGVPTGGSLLAAATAILLAALLLLAFFRIRSLDTLLGRFRRLQRYRRFWEVTQLAAPGILKKVLLLSLFRFAVFSAQLYLLLDVFDAVAGIMPTVLMIVLTFFVMTLVPSFAFADLGIRGAAGVFFFGYLFVSPAGVVLALLALWLINLALPAAAGAVFLALSGPHKTPVHDTA
jgi:uncharacterized membrane protein YbhN (UPF0104 family)